MVNDELFVIQMAVTAVIVYFEVLRFKSVTSLDTIDMRVRVYIRRRT